MARLDVAYDLACSPATYDFVSFLLRCEMDRIDAGADEIAIHILPGPNGGFRHDPYWPFSIEERRAMLERVVLPMAKLFLPSVVSCMVHQDRLRPVPLGLMEARYGFRWQVEAAKRNIYPFRSAVDLAPRQRPYVTITLRETEHWPSRNSNLSEWTKAAQILRIRGFDVFFVRDTRRAEEAIEKFTIGRPASHDLRYRMRLYAGATQNFFVNNGPAWLCWFAGFPTMIFKMCALDAPCVSAEYFASCGLPAGAQLANARPEQHIVWADDTAENILSAYGALGLAA